MLSKNQIKLINQLNQKKYRKKYGLFFAEGIKTVKELLASSFELEILYATADLLYTEENKTQLITERELKKISALKTPQSLLAVFKIPEHFSRKESKKIIALDGVRDPGNLGTIIRLCDWFGVSRLVCSTDTVDCYNPKTIQATMGSLARVQVEYVDLAEFLDQTDKPIYGAFMDGQNIYREELANEAIIIMGNEANGISNNIESKINHRIAIPQFGNIKATESLNVATATAIITSEFMRKG